MADEFDPEPAAEPEVAAPTTTARLRSFEDEVFGKDAPRINGEVERGIGSPFSKMTDHQRRHYNSLLNLVSAEKGVADASANLAAAETAHNAAVKAATDSE